jgi:alpha-galactosidase
MRVSLGGVEVALEAESLERVEGGIRLLGKEVRVYPPFPARAFFRHGWQSWSLTAWVDLREAKRPLFPEARRPQADDPFLLESSAWWGSGVGALKGPGDQVLLLGALGVGARVRGEEDLLLGRYAEGEGEWFLAYGEEAEVFAAYSRLLPGRLPGRPPRVFCTWYSHYTGISEALLLALLEEIGDYPFEVFQVDDGWQTGPWATGSPTRRFPQRAWPSWRRRVREEGPEGWACGSRPSW